MPHDSTVSYRGEGDGLCYAEGGYQAGGDGDGIVPPLRQH